MSSAGAGRGGAGGNRAASPAPNVAASVNASKSAANPGDPAWVVVDGKADAAMTALSKALAFALGTNRAGHVAPDKEKVKEYLDEIVKATYH